MIEASQSFFAASFERLERAFPQPPQAIPKQFTTPVTGILEFLKRLSEVASEGETFSHLPPPPKEVRKKVKKRRKEQRERWIPAERGLYRDRL